MGAIKQLTKGKCGRGNRTCLNGKVILQKGMIRLDLMGKGSIMCHKGRELVTELPGFHGSVAGAVRCF